MLKEFLIKPSRMLPQSRRVHTLVSLLVMIPISIYKSMLSSGINTFRVDSSFCKKTVVLLLALGLLCVVAPRMAAAAIAKGASNGEEGGSFSLDIGTAGTNRLVVITAGGEVDNENLTTVTVNGNGCHFIVEMDHTGKNTMEMWYCNEADLGSDAGTQTVAYTGGSSNWALHATVFTGVAQSVPNDYDVGTADSSDEITPTAIDVSANGLVVMGACHGAEGRTISWTSPLATAFGAAGPHPNSAELFSAWGVETSADTYTYTGTFSESTTRATGIVASWDAVAGNSAPTLTVNQPDGIDDTVTVGDDFTINYDMADSDDVVTVDFYYDSDGTPGGGVAIDDCQNQIEGTGATCVWDTTGMDLGDYYIYGLVDDGTNPEVSDSSSGTMSVQGPCVTGSDLDQAHFRFRDKTGGETGSAATITLESSNVNPDVGLLDDESGEPSFSHTVTGTSNTILLLAVAIDKADATDQKLIGVTYGAQSLTQLDIQRNTTDVSVELWYLLDPNDGTYDITMESATVDSDEQYAAVAFNFTGVDVTNATSWYDVPSESSNGISSETPTISNVSYTDGTQVLAIVGFNDKAGLTSDGGQTEIATVPMDPGIEAFVTVGAAYQAATGTVDFGWTAPEGEDDTYEIIAVSLVPAAGGAGADFTALEDTGFDGWDAKNVDKRVRFLVSNGEASDSCAISYELQVAQTYLCAAGDYSVVTTAAGGHWQIVTNDDITNGEDTENVEDQFSNDALTDPASMDFEAGEVIESSDATGDITLEVGEFTEIEFSIKATSNATDGACYCFRLYDTTNDEELSYDKYALVCLSGATAVTLLSFTATGDNGKVKVEWETAQEVNNRGFHLHRATSPGGPFERLTDKVISGSLFSGRGRAYTYEDTDVIPGRRYYYKLEEIDIYGTHTFHGPICVDWDGDGMPDDWEIAYGLNPGVNDSYLDSDGDGLTNLGEYEHQTDPFNPDSDGDGIPDGEDWKRDRDRGSQARTLTQGVQILASDDTGITLELSTDGFDMEMVEAQGEVFERLRILDYIHGYTDAVGKPELPIKGILVDVPEGKSPALTVTGTESQTYPGYDIYPVPEKALHGEGEMAHVGEVFAMDEAAYSTDAFYPDVGAQLGKTYLFRGQQRLQVVFYPLAFNPVTKELMHYTRIRLRVAYGNTAETPLMGVGGPLLRAIGAPQGQGAAGWSPPSQDPSYKIQVSEEGIYRLTKSFFTDNGISLDGMDLSQVRLYNLGEEVAIHVYDQGTPDQFDDGDYIEFYGRPVDSQYAKYATDNVYWLTTQGGSGAVKRMEAIDGTPGSGTVASTHVFTVHQEQDQAYWGVAPGGDSMDRWFFSTAVPSGNPVDFDLSLPGAAGKGSVKILMGGAWNTDHEVAVSIKKGETTLATGTFTWSGIALYEATIDGVGFGHGEHTVTIACNSEEDAIVVDWFEVTYPRSFVASNDELIFIHDAGYRYQVTGFTGNDLFAFDISSADEVARVTNFQTIDMGGSYTLECEPQTGAGERTYYVLSTGAAKTPSGVSQDSPSTLSDTANGADYILITHRDLGWDGNGDPYSWLSDLVALRQAQGLRVMVADVEDIYDEFSYGIVTPEAIKDSIGYAYTTWSPPAPQYVVLVGDTSYDYKDNMGSGAVNYAPGYLIFTQYRGETVTDEWFACVSGDDAIADLYIGRLPAASAAEAAVMVNKILAYETTVNTKTWEKNTLLIADNQIEAYESVFEAMNEDAAALIPAGLNAPFKGYLNDYLATGDLTEYIKEKINEGALIVNYSGHGSVQIWAHETLFNNGDVAALTNEELPLFVSMSCETGYFVYPYVWNFPSLAEALLRSEKGAIAALMPTGMTEPEGQHILDTALFDAIFTEDIRTLGPAISAAKQTLLANGAQYEEVSETFLLFGDPATGLKIPLPRRPTGVSLQSASPGITISWNAATDCNGNPVSGYNIYRSTTPGGVYTKVNSSLIVDTEYTDTTAEDGTTYYYVVRAVDSDGDESVQSLQLGALAGIGTGSGTPSTGSGTGSGSSGGSSGPCFISTAGGWIW